MAKTTCKGSERGGVTPGAGKNMAQEWREFDNGNMRCPFCQRFIPYTETGRLTPHSRTGD